MADILLNFDPKTFPPSHYVERFKKFLEEYEYSRIKELVLLPKDKLLAISINCHDLINYDAPLAYSLIYYHSMLMPLFISALTSVQTEILLDRQISKSGNIKNNVQIRLVNFPVTNSLSKNTIEELRIQEDKNLIQISGTVVKVSNVRMLESSKEFECLNPRCRFRFKVYADMEQDNMLPQIKSCPRLIKQDDDSVKKCNSSQIREIEDAKVCVDYQEIKIQDCVEHLNISVIPKSIVVILQTDLVDRLNPGDEVVVIGSIIRRWKSVVKGNRSTLEIAILANNVIPRYNNNFMLNSTISRDEIISFKAYWQHYRATGMEIVGRDKIVNAVCPHLCGMFLLKLATLLVLLGGIVQENQGGFRRRNQIHLLVVGDPGCGKSQLLRFAAKILPRSILTTGIGTTGAGLTCAVVRESKQLSSWGEWSLEAGAMVLASGGLCCIDEFSSIRDADRAAIHEAMEQQTVSIAKAGLTVKLNAQTAVIAASNPKGNYDINSDISVNTAIATPLLSRFDVVFVVIDQKSKTRDKKVSTYLLLRALKEIHRSDDDHNQRNDSEETICWDLNSLRKYVTIARDLLKPKMTLQARCLLMRYYQTQRQSEDRSTARTTVRLLESLLRLSEAHAKLMFHEEVLIVDAVMAIACIAQMNHHNSILSDHVDDNMENNETDRYQKYEEFIFQIMNYSMVKLNSDVARMQQSEENKPQMTQTVEHFEDNLNPVEIMNTKSSSKELQKSQRKRAYWESLDSFSEV